MNAPMTPQARADYERDCLQLAANGEGVIARVLAALLAESGAHEETRARLVSLEAQVEALTTENANLRTLVEALAEHAEQDRDRTGELARDVDALRSYRQTVSRRRSSVGKRYDEAVERNDSPF